MIALRNIKPVDRTIENPLIGDKVTFLKTSDETNGEYSLIEIELVADGGNGLHYHKTFSETFEVLEGELTLIAGGEEKVLQAGESRTVPPGILHCFKNKSGKRVKFLVEFTPGQPGFEQALKIAYGLARDGRTNKESVPRNFYHLAVLVKLGETFPAGILMLATPLFKWGARRAERLGIADELIKRYC